MEKSFLAHSAALVRRLGMSERGSVLYEIWKARELARLTGRNASA